jgi:hypothetical protein
MSSYSASFSQKLPESYMKKPTVFGDDDKLKNSSFPNKDKFKSLNSSTNEAFKKDSNRKDKYGNPIIKNNKIHKISFSDQFVNERSLVQVNKVESFKSLNNIEDHDRKCINCIVC